MRSVLRSGFSGEYGGQCLLLRQKAGDRAVLVGGGLTDLTHGTGVAGGWF
jgi:hypothetical protein